MDNQQQLADSFQPSPELAERLRQLRARHKDRPFLKQVADEVLFHQRDPEGVVANVYKNITPFPARTAVEANALAMLMYGQARNQGIDRGRAEHASDKAMNAGAEYMPGYKSYMDLAKEGGYPAYTGYMKK